MMAQYRKSPYYYITYEYTDHIKDSVHVKRSIKPSDLIIKTDQKTDKVTANVIEVIENSARTKHSQFELKVESDQTIVSDLDQDVIKLACLDRHHKSGDISLAFAHGFQ